MTLFDVLRMMDPDCLELPLIVQANGDIPCAPQSVYMVTLRFMAEEETAVTVPISSPVLIPWYDCNVSAFNPNSVRNSLDVWLDYERYVTKKWKNKVLFDTEE